MDPLKIPQSSWVSSRTMWQAHTAAGGTLSYENFLCYLSRSRHRMTVRPRQRGRGRRKYLLEELPLIHSTHLEATAVQEARIIAADADASGDWLTWQDLLRRCGRIHPRYGQAAALRKFLWFQRHPIRRLFPDGIHRGRDITRFRLQRWLLADLDTVLEKLSTIAASPRRSAFPEAAELPPGCPWVPLSTLCNERSAKTRYRLAHAAHCGNIRALSHKKHIYIDAAEATEFLNWRSRDWLTKKGWSPQQITARHAWQQSAGLTCPWSNDNPTALAIFAPEFALS